MKQKKFHLGMGVIYVILSVWAMTTIYPIVWVVLNSFKDKKRIVSDSFSLPLGEKFSMANYQLAFEKLDIFGAYRNSLIISFSVAFVVIILAGMASYGLVRYEFRGKILEQHGHCRYDVPSVCHDCSGVPHDEHVGYRQHAGFVEVDSGNRASADCGKYVLCHRGAERVYQGASH